MGGIARARMSLGGLVQMTHWSGKASGTISGQGWMPPGLDGLDYTQPLEFLSLQPESITGTALAVVLNSTPRGDQAPWALALVEGEWLPTPCVLDGDLVTITAVTDAVLYTVSWLPKYMVFASRPSKNLSTGGASAVHGWSITWEEI
ncbi:MAG: hypothetical protein U1A62_11475 [Pseudomonas sp.]|nr:hypothetical protein [Pseudomonas sp.]